MPATPADIAKYTTDGVVITAVNEAIKSLFSDAIDAGETEIEMFYDTEADAQAMLNEKFAILSAVASPHEAIEVDESLGIGSVIPVGPTIPTFLCVDEDRGLSMPLRCIQYAYDMGSDRFSVEVMK